MGGMGAGTGGQRIGAPADDRQDGQGWLEMGLAEDRHKCSGGDQNRRRPLLAIVPGKGNSRLAGALGYAVIVLGGVGKAKRADWGVLAMDIVFW